MFFIPKFLYLYQIKKKPQQKKSLLLLRLPCLFSPYDGSSSSTRSVWNISRNSAPFFKVSFMTTPLPSTQILEFTVLTVSRFSCTVVNISSLTRHMTLPITFTSEQITDIDIFNPVPSVTSSMVDKAIGIFLTSANIAIRLSASLTINRRFRMTSR